MQPGSPYDITDEGVPHYLLPLVDHQSAHDEPVLVYPVALGLLVSEDVHYAELFSASDFLLFVGLVHFDLDS